MAETISQNDKLLEAKQAAKIAADYAKALFPDIRDIALEEIELSDDGSLWFITLSFREERSKIPSIAPLKYKIFKVKRDTGEVVAMKIRELE